MKNSKGILIISPTYYPDVGGVETHLLDLVRELSREEELRIFVATHKPIVTSGVKFYIRREAFGNVIIYRFWWFGRNLFHFFERYPVLQFFYLCPHLFFRTLVLMILNRKKIDVIHGHGLSGAFVGMLLKNIFKRRLVVSTHAVYEIYRSSITAKLMKHILNQADKILCLSRASYNELISFGVDKMKVGLYKYWVDQNIFRPLDKFKMRKELGIENKFTVLFVGRLMEMKGVKILCAVAKTIPKINFMFIGHGPLERYLISMSKNYKNILFLGKIDNKTIDKYYNSADVFCIPSQYEEGFGRVVEEAVSCGVPVIGANKGGIPEAVDETVSILMEPVLSNLKEVIEDLYNNEEKLDELAKNCFSFSRKYFSRKNAEAIINSYYE